ncbi:DNA cytosine methyltransferase [Clostridium magnum]|uniref:DNA (cytosine-5-)-methyltransferase n=1 Tax=Clostridium magnum DSM 2767 TaxID=1121326 RepID=A0A161Y4D2_9CLOT|nr:DNA cytosine methyltransferase [Clostridium magnum]KZL92999.1 modification methylase HaeIII [Clostridium magnum DSM 2767]SHJ22950.1 DNA (cytosine-5)-methyltransferase 1 [Clostridium magnum DSM 2767]
MIKKRKMKLSKRGIYLQDKELGLTNLTVGSHYRYILDVKSKKLFIISSDNEKDNKVSKRVTKEGNTKAVIDIRKKEVLEAFQDVDYLQVTIKNSLVVVEGYVNAKESFVDKAVSLVKGVKSKAGKITSITDLIKVKKISEVVMSVKDLKKAVGFEQLSFDFSEVIQTATTAAEKFSNSKELKNKVKNLEIPLKVVSLFSGAGLLDMGFKKCKGTNGASEFFEIIFATDISADACLTYSKNIGPHIVNADIRDLDLTTIPKAPIVIGGSPCVKYSNSNRVTNINKQLHEAERILDIEDNILLRKYIEAVKHNDECVVFVHENVGQVNTIGEGKLLEEIKSELKDFEITSTILNAAEYGAQERKRSILIGSKIGKIDIQKPKLHAVQTVRQAFEGLTDATPNQQDYSKPKPLTLERMKFVPSGGNVHDIPQEFRPSGQHSDYFKRIEWDKPSITIVNPRKAMILHPELNRILSVRECARLQGLDDNFIFYGSLSSKQLQVCNGVPVGMASAIADTIKEAIMQRVGALKPNLSFSV